MRILVAGWSSVLHGEATAGDSLAMQAVSDHLRGAGHTVDVCWSPAMFLTEGTRGGLRYDDVEPSTYPVVLWVCGPVTGRPVREFHARFARSRRIAVGVSVLDPDDPAVTAFDHVLPRDAPGRTPNRDLAARPELDVPDVVGVFLTHGQGEYGARRRHDEVDRVLGDWLRGLDVARLELDTRLDPRDWRAPASAQQVLAVVSRLDVVVTTRLHGLVLAVRCGVPALAVDPVAGGGKVSGQARAWGWPAVLTAEGLDGAGLQEQFAWCRSGSGRAAARDARDTAATTGREQLTALDRAVAAAGAR